MRTKTKENIMSFLHILKAIGIKIPYILLQFGIIYFLIGITISIYKLLRKQLPKIEILAYFLFTSVSALILALVGGAFIYFCDIGLDVDMLSGTTIFAYFISIIFYAIISRLSK